MSISRLKNEVSELCFDGDARSRKWQNRSEQIRQQALQTQYHAYVLSVLVLPPFFRAEPYTLFSSPTFPCLMHSSMQSSLPSSDLGFFFRSGSRRLCLHPFKHFVFLRIVSPIISDTANTREHVACDTLFQALFCSHLFFRCSPVS